MSNSRSQTYRSNRVPTMGVRGPFERNFDCLKSLQKAIYGNVLLCRHRKKNVKRAVKVLKKSLIRSKYSSDNLPVFESAENEIKVLEKMRDYPNPYVLSLSPPDEQFETENMVYVSTPFCEEGELFSKCNEGSLSKLEVNKLFRKIMEGVNHLHVNGYVHNDISLENILLKRSSENSDEVDPVICDFGLSSLVGERAIRKGKIQYQAPEVIFGDVISTPSTPKSDVYSLGVVLFILTFKYPPYDCPHPKDARYAHIQAGKMQELLSLWKVEHLASPLLVSLISSMLSEDPKCRPSLEEVMQSNLFYDPSNDLEVSNEMDLEVDEDRVDLLFSDTEDNDMMDSDEDEPHIIRNTPQKVFKQDDSLLGTSPDSTFGINLMQNRISL